MLTTTGIGVCGVFIEHDPGARDQLARQGQIAFNFGQFRIKGQHMGTGQATEKAYNRKPCNLIAPGKANPSFLISHELPLDTAVESHEHFDVRREGWNTVVLKPGR